VRVVPLGGRRLHVVGAHVHDAQHPAARLPEGPGLGVVPPHPGGDLARSSGVRGSVRTWVAGCGLIYNQDNLPTGRLRGGDKGSQSDVPQPRVEAESM